MSEHRIVDIGPLLEKLRNDFPPFNPNSDLDLIDVSESVASEIMDLEELPVIDPETMRPVAHWEVGGVNPADDVVGNWVCSLCNETSPEDSSFCPYCGAKMEE